VVAAAIAIGGWSRNSEINKGKEPTTLMAASLAAFFVQKMSGHWVLGPQAGSALLFASLTTLKRFLGWDSWNPKKFAFSPNLPYNNVSSAR